MNTKHLVVLAIDDAPDSLHFLSEALEGCDMSVIAATSGTMGIELARRIHPDVILLDARMPCMDGFETCRRLKAIPDLMHVPVIFMTGLSDTHHVVEGLKAGGVDYVTKPAQIDVLVARIVTHALNAKAIARARAAFDRVGRNIISFNLDGSFDLGSNTAIEFLESRDIDLSSSNHPLKLALQNWLHMVKTMPVSRARPLLWDDIVFSFLGVSSESIMVRVSSSKETSHIDLLVKHFHLTEREAEVLVWLARGKTNQDIGEVLGVSVRTINKHLEQVFQKMGVENRTAAALLADRLLHNQTFE